MSTIFADKSVRNVRNHDNYEKYGLSKKTRYYGIPRNKFVRVLKAISSSLNMRQATMTFIFRSLNIFRYGKPALSFSLLFMSIALLERGPFDIIHCQFGALGPSGVALKQICRSQLQDRDIHPRV